MSSLGHIEVWPGQTLEAIARRTETLPEALVLANASLLRQAWDRLCEQRTREGSFSEHRSPPFCDPSETRQFNGALPLVSLLTLPEPASQELLPSTVASQSSVLVVVGTLEALDQPFAPSLLTTLARGGVSAVQLWAVFPEELWYVNRSAVTISQRRDGESVPLSDILEDAATADVRAAIVISRGDDQHWSITSRSAFPVSVICLSKTSEPSCPAPLRQLAEASGGRTTIL